MQEEQNQVFDFDAAIKLMAAAQKYIAQKEDSIADTIMEIKSAKSGLKIMDEQIRFQAFNNFQDTGDKKPHEKVWLTLREKRIFDSDVPQHALMQNPGYARIKGDFYEEAMTILMRLNPDFIEPDLDKIEKDFKKGESATPFPFTTAIVPTVNVSSKLGEYSLEDSDA